MELLIDSKYPNSCFKVPKFLIAPCYIAALVSESRVAPMEQGELGSTRGTFCLAHGRKRDAECIGCAFRKQVLLIPYNMASHPAMSSERDWQQQHD
eukprot:6201218-Pleurochrysis_carterae.AAC.2